MSTLADATAGDVLSFEALEVLARALHVKDAELQPTLDAIVVTALQTVRTARHAGLILVRRHELIPQTTVGEPPHVLDLLQQERGEGPCLDAAERQAVNRIQDTSIDERWPQFMAEAVKQDVGSMLCVPLWVDERTLGTLSLYADVPDAFSALDEPVVRLFTTLASIALTGAQRADQLNAALRNRELIGQAKGILMERLRITEDAAFVLLAQVSQNQNKKLVAVAQRLVETGELPGPVG